MGDVRRIHPHRDPVGGDRDQPADCGAYCLAARERDVLAGNLAQADAAVQAERAARISAEKEVRHLRMVLGIGAPPPFPWGSVVLGLVGIAVAALSLWVILRSVEALLP